MRYERSEWQEHLDAKRESQQDHLAGEGLYWCSDFPLAPRLQVEAGEEKAEPCMTLYRGLYCQSLLAPLGWCTHYRYPDGKCSLATQNKGEGDGRVP